MDQPRELLRECAECRQDYPARQWRRSKTLYREGVTGWICPQGHEMKRCDSDYHEWYQSDEYEQVCVRCYISRFHMREEATQ